jgi:hypothetical protein
MNLRNQTIFDRIQIGPQFVPRYARKTLNLEHSRRRHSAVMDPLMDCLRLNADLTS